MKHEDWLQYQRQADLRRLELFGAPPRTETERIEALRAEVDALACRLKEELLVELRSEIERLVTLEAPYARGQS